MPLDTIIDMLLHLKNKELASPLLDSHVPTISHAQCKELGTTMLRQYALSDMAPELYIVDSEHCQVLQYILIL